MEPLIVVYQFHAKPPHAAGRCVAWAWLKKRKDAIETARKTLPNESILDYVWVCEWRKAPSKYELIFGYAGDANSKAPIRDFAEDMREKKLRKPKVDWRRNKSTKEAVIEAIKALAPAQETRKAKTYNPYFIYEAPKHAT